MNTSDKVQLKRDCEAVQIPAGTTVKLPAGTRVTITQTLGGSYTVQTQAGLFRIADKDAEALGLAASRHPGSSLATAPDEVSEEQVWAALRTCYDPEIPVNIVDLGLVYDMHLHHRPEGGSSVSVKMTLTAPGCGMGGVIAGDAQQKLLNLPGVEDAEVEIVWDPPWHHSRITEAGRKILGME
jgi:probable FeS assembly SUF system protein SufT